MTTLNITLSGENHELLDLAVLAVLKTVDPKEVSDVTVAVRDHAIVNDRRIQNRRITIVNPTDKVVGKFARLDVPKTVSFKVIDS